jgi:hypothetical protein
MREWFEREVDGPARQKAVEKGKREPLPIQFTPATADELAAIAAIEPGKVTYIPGIATKRFARQIQGASVLTEAQRVYLWGVVWHFRRQIVDRDLPLGLRLVKIAAKKTQKGAVKC